MEIDKELEVALQTIKELKETIELLKRVVEYSYSYGYERGYNDGYNEGCMYGW